jgi:hypothetical protein
MSGFIRKPKVAPPIDRVSAFCRRHDHLNPAEILGAAPRFAQLRHRPTQMALDRRRPDVEGTPGYQPRVLKSSINVDNLRWKMIGVCLHQPPRPMPARLAHLACHAPNDLDDRFHEAGIVEGSIHGTGSMLVDSSFEKN